MSNVFLGAGSRLARYVRNDSSRQMVKESVAHLQEGGVLVAVPRRHPHHAGPDQCRWWAASGLIAKHAHVPVQTLIIETDSPFLSKGWPLFTPPRAADHLPRAPRQALRPPADVPAFTAELDRYYGKSWKVHCSRAGSSAT